MAEPSPSPARSSHTTMKRPSASAATAGVHCESDALVTNEFPIDLGAVRGNDLAADIFVAVGRIDRIRPHNDDISVR